MKLTIKAVGPIKEAELVIHSNRSTVIAGDNGAGKSTALKLLGMILRREKIPSLNGEKLIAVGDLKDWVQKPAKTGGAQILLDDGSELAIGIPSGAIRGQAEISASEMACGQVQWSRMPEKWRLKAGRDLMATLGINTDVDLAALERACPNVPGQLLKRYFNPANLEAGYKAVDADWTQARADWKAVTGEAPGSAKIDAWQPDGWRPILTGQTDESLKEVCESAKKAWLAANGNQYADERDMVKAKEAAGRELPNMEELEDNLARAIKNMEYRAEGDAHDLEETRKAVQAAADKANAIAKEQADLEQNELSIRQCNGFGDHKGKCTCGSVQSAAAFVGRFYDEIREAFNKKSEELLPVILQDAKSASLALEKLLQSQAEANAAHAAEIAKAEQQIAEAVKLTAEIKAAQERYAVMVEKNKQAVSRDECSRLEAAYQQAEADLAMFRQWAKAKDIAIHISHLTAIRDALAPDGLQKEVMLSGLQAVNGKIADLTQRLGFPDFYMDQDMEIRTTHARARGLSTTYAWMADVLLQVVWAIAERSRFLLIDEAHLMSSPEVRKQFFAGLDQIASEHGIHVVVGMACTPIFAANTIGRPGVVGAVNWIADGFGGCIVFDGVEQAAGGGE